MKSSPLHAVCILGAAIACSPVHAQQSPPPLSPAAAAAGTEAFPFEIGRLVKQDAVYSIEATQPNTSKLTGQKVRLKVVETSGRDTTTRYFSLATGKHKTVAQIDATLSEAFRRFLSNPSPTATAQEICKIGDVRYGGEVRIVVDPSNQLRFDNLTPGQPVRASFFSRADIESFQAALTGVPPT